MKKLETGQVVGCTVKNIAGTVVFVKLDDFDAEGTIVFSEISPGRIRNIREYVFPGKKIVCKVLKTDPRGTYLSLRRVKLKERREFNEACSREKSFGALLKTIIKERAEEVLNKIKEKESSIFDFLGTAQENPQVLEKYLGKMISEKVGKILQSRRTKEVVLSKRVRLSSKAGNGISIVRGVLKQASADCLNCEIIYIAAGRYSIRIRTTNPKEADSKLSNTAENIRELARQGSCEFFEEK